MFHKPLLLLLLTLLWFMLLPAQETVTEPPSVELLQAQIQAISDSLLQMRESAIATEYGFRDTDKLHIVAEKLAITDIARWKSFLEIEPENEVLDAMSLRRLGITPYRALLAQQYSIYGYTELSKLGDIAHQKQIPVKKLRQFAGVESTDQSRDNFSLQALNRTPEKLQKFEQDFNENKMSYGLTILLYGVAFVFSALAITALAISQLRRLNREKKNPKADIVLDSAGKVKSKSQDLNADIIAAAIAALHLHKQGIDERRRLLLTFKRAHSDQWRSSATLNMPNRDILRKRS